MSKKPITKEELLALDVVYNKTIRCECLQDEMCDDCCVAENKMWEYFPRLIAQLQEKI